MPADFLESAPTSTDAAVVTYETVLQVENFDLVLRPGMTATAEIITGTLQGATLISNAALSFTPDRGELPGVGDDSERGSGMMALMPYLEDRWKCPREAGRSLGCAWVLEGGEPRLGDTCHRGGNAGRLNRAIPATRRFATPSGAV